VCAFTTLLEGGKIMEFTNFELGNFVSSLIFKLTEVEPNRYKQIRKEVKEIIDQRWDD